MRHVGFYWWCVWWPVLMGLSQIDRYVPCKLGFRIIFSNGAAMKVWKRLATVLRGVGYIIDYIVLK